jgi:iron complex outermembrane receptor protein
VNLREIIHDTTTTVTGDNGATKAGTVTYYTSHSGVIPTTDFDVSYAASSAVTLSGGAQNVFNRYPDRLNAGLLAAYQKQGYPFAATQYTSGPLGINGGFYYLKATYTF